MDLIIGVSRFKNIDGVSCYMVSILHILQQIPILCNLIKNDKYLDLIKNKINDTKNITKFITYELSRAIKLSLENDNIVIAPNSLKKLLGENNSIWSEIEHQDSQEFYIYLITKIEEECGQKNNYLPEIIESNKSTYKFDICKDILQILALNYIYKSEQNDYSIIKKMFIGYLISNTQCYYCMTDSPCFESFITLPLSIPNKNKSAYSLEECLNSMIKDEKLDINNKLLCDICGLKNQSIKKVQIWKAPQILVIQLKRFVVNNYGIQTSKITTPIIYPINDFDIYEYFNYQSPYKENSVYNLIGVNIHKEISHNSLNAGHYISIVKNIYNNKWYMFDDSNEPVELEENEIQNKNAYLLFYYKK